MISEQAVWRPGPALRPFVSWAAGCRQAGVDPAVHRGLGGRGGQAARPARATTSR